MELAEAFTNNGILFWSRLPLVKVDMKPYKVKSAYFAIYDITPRGLAGVKTMAIKPENGERQYHTIVFSPKPGPYMGKMIDDKRFNFLGSVFGFYTQKDFQRSIELHHAALEKLTRCGY